MMLKYEQYNSLSENMIYHVERNIPIRESVFRAGSDAQNELLIETRKLYESGYELNPADLELMESTDSGRQAWNDKTDSMVVLDSPSRVTKAIRKQYASTKNKKYYVWRPGKGTHTTQDGKKVPKAKLIAFGHKDYEVRTCDEEARKSFISRHGCSSKTNRDTAGYWACHAPRLFGKQLGLTCSKTW